MKITVGNESVVYQGPAMEDTIWGICQFPNIQFGADGKVYCNVHIADDIWEEIGKNESEAWCVSTDNGLTWARCDKPNTIGIGTLLPNGDRIHFPSLPSYIVPTAELKKARTFRATLPGDKSEKMADGSWPYPALSWVDIARRRNYIYDIDTLPDEFAKKEWHMHRVKAGETETKEEIVPVEHPYMSLNGVVGEETMVALRPWPICHTKVDPDGNVWACSYTGCHLDPRNGAPNPYSAAVLYKSTDNAKSFKLQSYIPFIPDTLEEPTAWLSPAFNENDIAFMPDGSMIVLLRTVDAYYGGPEWTPMYFARSTDGGKTFSKPVKFSDGGVLPSLVSLKCGVTLAAYGRPGIFVRATSDPSGIVWDDPIEVMTPNDRSHLMNNPPQRPDFHQFVGSCCNVDCKAINDHQALLLYSDFFYPDVTGKTTKRYKTILARIITVVE